MCKTTGDDSQVLVWNINQSSNDSRSYYHQQNTQQQRYSHQPPRSVQDPLLAYVADAEVNSLTWSKSAPEWIGVGFGKTIQALRV
jgi:WD repeat-containing protein 68